MRLRRIRFKKAVFTTQFFEQAINWLIERNRACFATPIRCLNHPFRIVAVHFHY